MIKKYCLFIVLCLLVATSFASSSTNMVLRFNSMYPVDGAFLTPEGLTDPNIRGIVGDYQPWILKSSKGELKADGRLLVQVRGLVFPNAPNDETAFRALVSCLTDDHGVVVTQNVISDPFPTGPKGDATITAHLALPHPCVAPIVMILNGDPNEGNVWFAVSGF